MLNTLLLDSQPSEASVHYRYSSLILKRFDFLILFLNFLFYFSNMKVCSTRELLCISPIPATSKVGRGDPLVMVYLLAHLPVRCYGMILVNSFMGILSIDGNIVLSLFHTHWA
jgi:hypothetical protein